MTTLSQTLEVAAQAHEAGDLVQAARLLTDVLESEPQHETALHQFGVLCREIGKHRDAQDLFRRAMRQSGTENLARYRVDLAESLLAEGRNAEALAECELARPHLPNDAQLLTCQSKAWLATGEVELAVDCMNEAVSAQPDDLAIRLDLAQLYEQLDLLDEATGEYSQILEQDPRHIRTILRLTSLMLSQNVAIENPWLERILTSLPYARDTDDRIQLKFALAHAYDQRREFSAALAAYDHANQDLSKLLSARRYTYDPTQVDPLLVRIKQTVDTDMLENWKRLAGVDPTSTATQRVLLVGMPCSGMRILGQMLNECAGVVEVELTEHVDRICMQALGRVEAYPEGVAAFHGATWASIRNALRGSGTNPLDSTHRVSVAPELFWYLGLVVAACPDVKIVHCERDEQSWACEAYASAITAGPYAAACCDKKLIRQAWMQHQQLLSHWLQVLPGDNFVSISFEHMMALPTLLGPELAEFLGLDLPALRSAEPLGVLPDWRRFENLQGASWLA